jgi:glucose/arabinose dehydrogenase
VNAARAIESHHADVVQLIAIGGNYGWPIEGGYTMRTGPMGDEKQVTEEMLRAAAARLGFRLVRDTRLKDPELDRD